MDFFIRIVKILQELPISFVKELAFSARGGALTLKNFHLSKKFLLFFEGNISELFSRIFKMLSMKKQNPYLQ